MSKVLTVTEQNFEQVVLMSQEPVLLELGAEWCGPCKTMAPELESLAQELAGKAIIAKADIDRSPLIAQTLGVRSVPTFVLFVGGRPTDGRQGAMRKAELFAMLEPYLPRASGALKPLEVVELLKQGRIQLVDIREAAVYQRSHIHGAVSLPRAELPTRQLELMGYEKHPVLYCRGGKEAEEVAKDLAEKGAPVAYLEGGVLAWETDGQRLHRP